jgi:hypothetical protein
MVEMDFKDIDNIDFNIVDDTVVFISSDLDGHEDFIDFLKENDVLDKFVYNFYNIADEEWKKSFWLGYGSDDIDYTLYNFLEDSKNISDDYLYNAFNWDKTKYGYDFWYDINEKWLEKCKIYNK